MPRDFVAASASEWIEAKIRFVHSLALATVLTLGVSAQEKPPALPPAEPLLPESALPAYEKEIDHAGMIRGWNKASLERGREIYQQICHACHGDLNVAGSIPTALRFGQGKFQHGSDPYTMYQTITRGWRMMVPQVQLVPQEKYDVIHYIRETFLKENNPGQWHEISADYLATLPKGSSRGPKPIKREPWREMNYGNFLLGTFEVMSDARRATPPPSGSLRDFVPADANIAQKAIAVRLDRGDGGIARGKVWLAFEHDTMRVAGAWTGDGFIDWHGINFDGIHVVRPRTVGTLLFETADVPGWANPATGDFEDLRIRGLDGRRFGPLPRTWARYRGLYRGDDRVVVSYEIGDAAILESYALASARPVAISRTLNIGKSSRALVFRAANQGAHLRIIAPAAVTRTAESGFEVIRIPADATPLRLAIIYGEPGSPGPASEAEPIDLAPFTSGGAGEWKTPIETPIIRGSSEGPFASDSFSLPPREANPWKNWMRTSGLDFLPGTDAAVVCCWDGDVWRVDGISGERSTVTWKRIASGLFQPLGIKVVNDVIHVACRDQIVRLRDLDGDGETDFYECFNSDHQVTEHFHEFAMGLQADPEGNFYYAKSARHDRTALVPHHGTLLKVSADGTKTEILANGFRAANGVCRNPDGTFFVTDQEGHWTPMNRINLVKVGGGFYGNMWSYGAPEDSADSAMKLPLCWIDKQFDRSPAELVWVESPAWGPLNGALLNLSYGRGEIQIVLREKPLRAAQAAVCVLPIPDFPTGIMRGRFHPVTGALYLCGMSAWATEQMHQPGGFYRVQATGRAAHVPVSWHVVADGVELTFSDPLERATVADVTRYRFRSWGLKRSASYGSAHIDERALPVTHAELAGDSRTLRLTIPGLRPAWGIEIVWRIRDDDGRDMTRTINGTIYALPRSLR